MASNAVMSDIPSSCVSGPTDTMSPAAFGWQGLSQLSSLEADIQLSPKWMITLVDRSHR